MQIYKIISFIFRIFSVIMIVIYAWLDNDRKLIFLIIALILMIVSLLIDFISKNKS